MHSKYISQTYNKVEKIFRDLTDLSVTRSDFDLELALTIELIEYNSPGTIKKLFQNFNENPYRLLKYLRNYDSVSLYDEMKSPINEQIKSLKIAGHNLIIPDTIFKLMELLTAPGYAEITGEYIDIHYPMLYFGVEQNSELVVIVEIDYLVPYYYKVIVRDDFRDELLETILHIKVYDLMYRQKRPPAQK